MKKKLSSPKMELFERIDEILWQDWDPIGVNHSMGARDEYQGYVPKILKFAIEGKDENQIAKLLDDIVEKQLGMEPNTKFSLEIAKKIIKVKCSIISKC